jgi:hypothetical protein
MRLAVISHKECVLDSAEDRYCTDGGFPMQIRAISELFAETKVVVPCVSEGNITGMIPLEGQHLSVVPLEKLIGKDLQRKLRFPGWLFRNSRTVWAEVRNADAVHAPIPGDVGTIGLIFALLQRKPLFVRHCGNWMVQTTLAEKFWKWCMEKFAGGRNVMLATGGSDHAPSSKNPRVRWIFSTSLRNDQLQNVAPKSLATDRPVRLIIACRQEQRKGTDIVLRSLPLIRQAIDVKLAVVGGGSLLPKLERLASELGVADLVKFHGKVGQSDVLELLSKADIFCYPTSASEGFPKVVVEALANGLPVITTRVSVLPQLMRDGCGVLIEPDPQQLADAVIRLCRDDVAYEKMSAAALAVASRFTLEKWKDNIAENLSEAWNPVFDLSRGHVLQGDGSRV